MQKEIGLCTNFRFAAQLPNLPPRGRWIQNDLEQGILKTEEEFGR